MNVKHKHAIEYGFEEISLMNEQRPATTTQIKKHENKRNNSLCAAKQTNISF